MKRGFVPDQTWFPYHTTEIVVVLLIIVLIIMYLFFHLTGVWQ